MRYLPMLRRTVAQLSILGQNVCPLGAAAAAEVAWRQRAGTQQEKWMSASRLTVAIVLLLATATGTARAGLVGQ